MIIVSDTSVITNLIQIDRLILLQQLFQAVIIPAHVFKELAKAPDHFGLIKEIDWISTKEISDKDRLEELMETLDQGEAEAILLALELKADALLIDEKKGRKIAQEYGILIIGLLGVLIEAKKQGFVSEIKPLLDRLVFEVGFRISPQLYQSILDTANE